MSPPVTHAVAIKDCARSVGFDLVGIVPAVSPQGVGHLRRWLEQGFAGEMTYMQRHAAAREHPRHVLEGARSIIVVAMNYATRQPTDCAPLHGRVSRYAWGDDYHEILRRRLRQLQNFVHDLIPNCRSRIAVDTAPLLERDFAVLAGIGWIGKNTMLINKRLGSWLFLGAVLLDVELEYDAPHQTDHCGSCTRCLDACPTDAFAGPHQLDSRRCISYLTIELRGPIPEPIRDGVGNWLFGCDVCQEVCPWNRKAAESSVSGFEPRQHGGNVSLVALLEANDQALQQQIEGTALTRAGLSGLRRNAAVALGNSQNPAALPVLRRLAASDDDTLRETARWAIQRIEQADERVSEPAGSS